MEKTGTTGTTIGDNGDELESHRRKRSIWSKPQKGLRRGSFDVLSNRSDSKFVANMNRRSSASSVLDSDFFGEVSVTFIYLCTFAHQSKNMSEFVIKSNILATKLIKFDGFSVKYLH